MSVGSPARGAQTAGELERVTNAGQGRACMRLYACGDRDGGAEVLGVKREDCREGDELGTACEVGV